MTIIAAGSISEITWLAAWFRMNLSWTQQVIAVHRATLDSMSGDVHVLAR